MDQYIQYAKSLDQKFIKAILEASSNFLVRFKELDLKFDTNGGEISVVRESSRYSFYTIKISEKEREHVRYGIENKKILIDLFNRGMMDLVREEKFFCITLGAERKEEVYKIKDELIMVISMISL